MRNLQTLALGPLLVSAITLPCSGEGAYAHRSAILGCSMDMVVSSDDAAVVSSVEDVVYESLMKSARELDTRDARSPLCAQARNEAVALPTSASAILTLYRSWETRTGGAISPRLGSLKRLWKAASESGSMPTSDAIEAARFSTGEAPDIDALGKAFALELAARTVTQTFPGLRGFLLNLGGDIVCRGVAPDGLPWLISLADPGDSAYNATPSHRVRLTDGAVVTSGNAHRAMRIGDREVSHVLDPRSGLPATGARGASVIAPDAVTANALSCALMVLGGEALPMVDAYGAVALLHTDNGATASSDWHARTIATPVDTTPAWSSGMRFQIDVKLPQHSGKKRPYLAAWITDKEGKPVRNLVVWGTKSKYQKSLKSWWKNAVGGDAARAAAVSKSTNKPGAYTIEWDGRDDAGAPVARGEYTVNIEVSEEDIGCGVTSAPVDCRTELPRKSIPLGGCKKSVESLSVTFSRH